MIRLLRRKMGIEILILSFFIFSSGAFSKPDNSPKIVFDQMSRDFGRVDEGSILTHTFVFRNAGDSPLLIKKVRTSCGCAAALVSGKEISAGENGEILVTFKTRGYEGDQTQYVYVESNDPVQPIKQLSISAAVNVPPRPRIALEDYSIDLGLMIQEDDIRVKTTIMNRGELELRVDLVHKEARFYLKGELIKPEIRIPAGKEATIEIKIPSQQKSGLIREYVLLKSNDPRRPNLSLYLTGYVVTKNQLKQLFKKYREIVESR